MGVVVVGVVVVVCDLLVLLLSVLLLVCKDAARVHAAHEITCRDVPNVSTCPHASVTHVAHDSHGVARNYALFMSTCTHGHVEHVAYAERDHEHMHSWSC